MSEETSWQTSNSRYLSTALAWLRGKLEARANQIDENPEITSRELGLAASGHAAIEPPPEPQSPPKGKRNRREPAAQTTAPSPNSDVSEAAPGSLAQLAAAMAAAELQTSDPPALIALARRLGLTPFEREVLLLCCAMELDAVIASLCARAQADAARPYPTFALAITLFDAPAWDALSPERPLRYWRLIEINQPGNSPLTTSALRADERIVSYLKGLNYLDDRLAPLFSPLELPLDTELPPSQQRLANSISARLQQLTAGESFPVIQLLGIDSPSKQLVAAQAARAVGLHVLRLPAALLPTQAPELETLARLWQRESLLLPLALYLEDVAHEADAPTAGTHSPVNRLLARTGGVIFVDAREALRGLAENSLRVDVAKPTATEQRDAWAAALGKARGPSPALLAAQFNLSVAGIRHIARRAAADTAAADSGIHDRLWAECLTSTRPRLDSLAQRVDAKATWEDIVLPQTETSLLHQIAAQVGHRSTVHESWGFASKMNRGLGISALFAGDSGTGKTMAAEVIANELRLNLYRIDLSAVVSKYIGETEKNLRRLFDAAEDGGAILFFDEADALFGKRSEVKDSHDRYANIEINYLLQRMEAYGGLAILATNRQSALDPAFMRRLRFVVNFPFPSIAQRKAMWEKAFPPQTPTHNLDFDRLARLNLTGGNITGIALNAAFQAAHSGEKITTQLIMESARSELRKLGRVINELEFHGTGRAGRVA
jgi:hypothetical protein